MVVPIDHRYLVLSICFKMSVLFFGTNSQKPYLKAAEILTNWSHDMNRKSIICLHVLKLINFYHIAFLQTVTSFNVIAARLIMHPSV